MAARQNRPFEVGQDQRKNVEYSPKPSAPLSDQTKGKFIDDLSKDSEIIGKSFATFGPGKNQFQKTIDKTTIRSNIDLLLFIAPLFPINI